MIDMTMTTGQRRDRTENSLKNLEEVNNRRDENWHNWMQANLAEKTHKEQKFEQLFEMLCQMNNGGPTRNEWTEVDKDSRSQLPTTPPGIVQVNRTKVLSKTSETEEIQFDELTIPQRNRIQSAIRNLVKDKFGIDSEEV